MAIKPQKTDLQRALKNCRGSFAIVGFFSFFAWFFCPILAI